MANTGPKTNKKWLLVLWKNKDGSPLRAPLSFAEIVDRAWRELKLKERTTISYLNSLVKAKILEKTVDAKRSTYYKPISLTDHSRELLKDFAEHLGSQYGELLDYFNILGIEAMEVEFQERCRDPSVKFDRIIELAQQRALRDYRQIKRILKARAE